MKQWLILAILASGVPAFAQKRDFLTNDEVEKVREAQEPETHGSNFMSFSQGSGSDQLQRLFGKEKKGRSLEVRELLEDYTNIIDALDTVSDDALLRGADLTLGTTAVRDAENRFLDQLQKIKDRAPADLDSYNVALTEALAATTDSMDLLHLDSGRRAMKLNERKGQDQEDDAGKDNRGRRSEKPDGRPDRHR